MVLQVAQCVDILGLFISVKRMCPHWVQVYCINGCGSILFRAL